MGQPICRLCKESHWPRDPHRWPAETPPVKPANAMRPCVTVTHDCVTVTPAAERQRRCRARRKAEDYLLGILSSMG